jgi:uncharacterized membrane protein
MPGYRLTHKAQQRLKEEQLFRCRNPLLADVVERNIQTIVQIRRTMEQNKTLQDHMADRITAFSGSMVFVYLHVAWFAVWVAINLHWTPLRAFDPFPFGLLTMIVSLEAIFLATFVLISQNRMGAVADQRADLDLQINLLAEHEITRILKVVDAIAGHMGVLTEGDQETAELEQDVSPEVLLKEIEERGRER